MTTEIQGEQIKVNSLKTYSDKEKSAASKLKLPDLAKEEAAKAVAKLSEEERKDADKVSKAISEAAHAHNDLDNVQTRVRLNNINHEYDEAVAALKDSPGIARAMVLRLSEIAAKEKDGLNVPVIKEVLDLANSFTDAEIKEANEQSLIRVRIPEDRTTSEPVREELAVPEDLKQGESMRDYLKRTRSNMEEKPDSSSPTPVINIDEDRRKGRDDPQDNVVDGEFKEKTGPDSGFTAKDATDIGAAAMMANSAREMSKAARELKETAEALRAAKEAEKREGEKEEKPKEERKEKEKRPIPETFRGVQGEIRKLLSTTTPDPEWERRLQEKQRELTDKAKADGVFGEVKKRVFEAYRDEPDYITAIENVNRMADEDRIHKEIDLRRASPAEILDYHEMIREYCHVAAMIGQYSLEVAEHNPPDPNLYREIQLRSWGSSLPWAEHRIMARKYVKNSGGENLNQPNLNQDVLDQIGDLQAMFLGGRRMGVEDETKDVAEILDTEIFGDASGFGEEFRKRYGLPKIIHANPASGVAKSFDPIEALNSVAVSGLGDQQAWYRASNAIDASNRKSFRLAARNGLLKLLVTNIFMGSSRIDALANGNGNGILQSELGVKPRDIAQWLTVDEDTKNALGCMFRLAGYEVKGGIPTEIKKSGKKEIAEIGFGDYADQINRRVKESLGKEKNFADFASLTDEEIQSYLTEITNILESESGTTRVAFTIFRTLGFPHGNAKMIELRAKYQQECPEFDKPKKGKGPKRLRPGNEPAIPITDDSDERLKEKDQKEGSNLFVMPARTLSRYTLRPLLDKLKPLNSEVTLAESLATEGMDGFIKALPHVAQNEIMRKYSDYGLLLDMMDAVHDIRIGQGAYAALTLQQKLSEIQKIVGTSNAKRLLSQEDRDAILDIERFTTEKGQTQLSGDQLKKLAWKIYDADAKVLREANTPSKVIKRALGIR